MNDRVVVEFINKEKNTRTELDIPVGITANDLVAALNAVYDLKMDIDNIFNCYLVSENPIAFLRGNKELSEYGIRNGSKIIYERGQKDELPV